MGVLRDFEPGDQAAVRRLVLDGLTEHWGTVDERLNGDLDDITGTYGHGRTVVYVDDLGIAGTGTCVPRDATTAEIVRMSVRPDQRRNGVGRQIVDELIRTATDWRVERITLETTAAWDEVVQFYLCCGFTITHHDDGGYGRDVWFEMRL